MHAGSGTIDDQLGYPKVMRYPAWYPGGYVWGLCCHTENAKISYFLTNMALGTKNINISGLKPISEAGNVLNYPKSPKRPVGMSRKSFKTNS